MSREVRAFAASSRRVLYVINDLALGGAQRVVLHQAAFLDRNRFTPEVASFEFETSGALIPAFEREGIPVHRLRDAREPPLAGVPRLDRLLRERRPDLVHTHLAAAGVLGRAAARLHGVPLLVTTLHNLSDWEEKRVTPLRYLDRVTLRLADTVVTVSDAIREAVGRVSPELASRTVTVRNGVPLESLLGAGAERESARAGLGYAPVDFVVGSVARLDPRKGLDVLIDAMALAAPARPELRLLIVGDGSERSALEERVRTHGLQARVTMVRHQVGVRPYLAAMDLFAAPSRTEGLGMAIIEALAAGVPVLGSRVGGIPEVVDDEGCGRLLPPGEPRAWAEALLALARRPPELAGWASMAPRRARRFSLEASGSALGRLYEKLFGIDGEATREARAA